MLKSTSTRLAPSPRVIDLLRSHKATQDREREVAGDAWMDTGHVFTSATGRPIDPRTALRAFTLAAERAGIAGASIHTLRHSAATAMLEDGVHLRARLGAARPRRHPDHR